MKLEGKFRDDFFEWLKMHNNIHYRVLKYEYLPQSAQFGLIKEYCVTIGIIFNVYPVLNYDSKKYTDIAYYFIGIEILNAPPLDNEDEVDFNSCLEAQTEVVKRVMELINK